MKHTTVILLSLVLGVPFTQIYASNEITPKRKGYTGGTVNWPVGETTVGDSKVWTRFGLKSSAAVWEGNPNDIQGNWSSIVLSSKGESTKQKRIQTGKKANYLTVFDSKRKAAIWIPFDAIQEICVEKPNLTSIEAIELQKEVYDRFYFANKPSRASDFKASVSVKLTHPFAEKSNILKGHVRGTLFCKSDSEWQEVPWQSISKIEFDRKGKLNHISQKRPYLYRTLGSYSNVWMEYVWMEYVVPAEPKKPVQPHDPNMAMQETP